ncbi:hypothetical protein HAL09_04180 [Helicobacter ailurogastricus]|uniref:Uncharacterized protein n=1 Tax=Helicobacter ailurogastricus TaxID=1578720 RepID=A0A0K2XE71_9HELI|nr:hypothetical protein HAL09_04180 [Helicobacter ailurogastricus]
MSTQTQRRKIGRHPVTSFLKPLKKGGIVAREFRSQLHKLYQFLPAGLASHLFWA